MPHVLDIGHGRLRGSVHGDDDRADNAIDAANFAHETEPLLEEDGRQDSSHDDGQGTQGSDEDGIDKGVGDEVAEFSKDHQRHACPPVEVLEVSVALAGLLVVLDVRLEQADLLQHEGDADEEARADGEGDAHGLERWRARAGRAQGAAAGASGQDGLIEHAPWRRRESDIYVESVRLSIWAVWRCLSGVVMAMLFMLTFNRRGNRGVAGWWSGPQVRSTRRRVPAARDQGPGKPEETTVERR